MTREIKFREWNPTSLPKMRQVDVLCENARKNDGSLCTQDDGVLMQFTGLHDKNEKEIYEGDVLEFKAESSEWKMGVEIPYCYQWRYENPEYEVIGNIYENPELLTSL